MKKVFTTLFIVTISLFMITGCGDKENTNKDVENNDTPTVNNSISSINDFVSEVKKLGIEVNETQMLASMVGAESGSKLTIDGKKLEIYHFDTSSDEYIEAEKNQKITLSGYGSYDAIVKNGYALMIDSSFPEYNSIIDIFNRLK